MAMARPILLVAPVTSAVLASSRILMEFSFVVVSRVGGGEIR